jgi:periplasmic protein CpxP/Spy
MSNSVPFSGARAPIAFAAALLAAAALTAPSTSRAETVNNSGSRTNMAAPPPAAMAARPMQHRRLRPESVNHRIAVLKQKLEINSRQEPQWRAVAAAMRENARRMRELIAEVRTQNPETRTAVEDLKTYQRFAEAHERGLRKLTTVFTRLYDSMSPAQKKNADNVFNRFRQRVAARAQMTHDRQPGQMPPNGAK